MNSLVSLPPGQHPRAVMFKAHQSDRGMLEVSHDCGLGDTDCNTDSAFSRGFNVCIIPGSRQCSHKHMYYKLFVTPFMFFSQGTPAGLVRYKVDPEAYPYSASIFDVDEKTGNVVTRVNLNEEPSLKFNVRDYVLIGILHMTL